MMQERDSRASDSNRRMRKRWLAGYTLVAAVVLAAIILTDRAPPSRSRTSVQQMLNEAERIVAAADAEAPTTTAAAVAWEDTPPDKLQLRASTHTVCQHVLQTLPCTTHTCR